MDFQNQEKLDEDFMMLMLGLCGFVFCAVAAKPIQQGGRRTIRRFKRRPINRDREKMNAYQYFLKMKREDEQEFFKYTRMTVSLFSQLLEKVGPLISKRKQKDGICAEQRLVITLQFLSQGGSLQNLAWTYQIGHATVHQIVHETCAALWKVLWRTYLKSPSKPAEWESIAEGFYDLWNFPNCIGALDGKHIHIECPPKSGSKFFNYKKRFSIILLAACDANYNFTLVDIGAYGSQSDGGVFRQSNFGQNFENNLMGVPPPKKLPNTNVQVPYSLVGDEAFPLKQYLMRPYPGRNLPLEQKIFNYRLSRARRSIENTFGVLVARWRILKSEINCTPENVDNIVKACVVLHNFCKAHGIGTNPATSYCPPGYVDTNDEDNGGWRAEINSPLRSVGRLSANNSSRLVYEIRAKLTRYFMSPLGEVPWQLNMVLRGSEP